MIPKATYRLQFNREFNLKRASELVDYFHQLHISHYYASPLTRARENSLHGYDMVDPSTLNPNLGQEEELVALIAHLREKGMGLILDVVPNHMYIADHANVWWQDVLENGPSSQSADYFDIDWHPPREQLVNKVLLPLLNRQYGEALENQEIQVIYDIGRFFLRYENYQLPLNPRSWTYLLEPAVKSLESLLKADDPHLLELQSILTALTHLPGVTETNATKVKERQREKEIIKNRLATLTQSNEKVREAIEGSIKVINGAKGNPQSFDALEEFLSRQPFRLCFWRVANDEINYRRFFDIYELAGIKTEKSHVFQAAHEFVFRLLEKQLIDGLRIDHIDGLIDPQQYLSDIQQVAADKHCSFILVEKILIGDEKLRKEWPTSGTVGYDFLNTVNDLFVLEQNQSALLDVYVKFTGVRDSPWELIYQCKLLALTALMSSELSVLARHLDRIKEHHRASRDITLESLRQTLRSVIASFPVYRTYIRMAPPIIHDEDRALILTAIERAKLMNPAISGSIFDFIRSVLLMEWPQGLSEKQKEQRMEFIMRFQQLTAPVTAIGIENTAFFRYHPLLSLNEVGSDLSSFGISLAAFHQKNQERLARWPHALLTTSTHDTKLSEDVRARINVLSEIPEEWGKAITQWQAINHSKKKSLNGREVPNQNEEYLFYQVLLGSFPLYPMDPTAHLAYVERIERYMVKALKEAKIHTSWINPHEDYESSVTQFIREVLSIADENPFMSSFRDFLAPLVHPGLYNSLSQVVLKMTCPGIPDFYQGSESWLFTLVDPDNRKAVDYHVTQTMLAMLQGQQGEECVNTLMRTPEDGRIKLYIISRGLQFRSEHPALFEKGSYEVIDTSGPRERNVVAFSRKEGSTTMITATCRFFTELKESGAWKDTLLLVPSGCYRELYTDAVVLSKTVGSRTGIFASELFKILPVAILVRES